MNKLRNLNHYRTNIGWFIALPLCENTFTLLLDIIKVLYKHRIDLVMIAINEHLPKLNRVHIELILHSRNLLHNKGLPLITVGNMVQLQLFAELFKYMLQINFSRNSWEQINGLAALLYWSNLKLVNWVDWTRWQNWLSFWFYDFKTPLESLMEKKFVHTIND